MSELPHRYQAARLLADLSQDLDEISAIEGALTYAVAASSASPDVSTLVELAPNVGSSRQYRELLYHLEKADIVGHSDAKIQELRSVFDAARVLGEREPVPENRVVANTPLSEDDIGDSVGSLVISLLELLQQAESELLILNPFFTEEGYERIGRSISDATARGVEVTIVTKSLTYGGTTQNERAMSQLLEDEETVPEKISLYEYVLDDDSDEEYPPTIHAKLTVVDEEQAYLGTANMTHRGLVENFEIGVIFHDETVRTLYQLVQEFLSSEYLHQVHYTSPNFVRE